MVSTCVRSSASSVPSAYSAASAIWSSVYSMISTPKGLKTQALPDVHHAAAKPRLYRIHRHLELRRQLLPAPAVVIRKQHKLLTVRLEPADTFQQALQFFCHFPASQGIRAIG